MSELALVREALTCPICLDLYSDPMTVPCGHTYCTDCIHRHWKHQRNMFTCPECRKVFYRKAAAVKNIVLSRLVEILKGTARSAGHRSARPHNVLCEECEWRRKLDDDVSCWRVEGRDRVEKVRWKRRGAPSGKGSIKKDCKGENVQRTWQASKELLQSLQDNLETLLQEAHTISSSAQEALLQTEESFTHITLLLETRRTQVKEQIRLHEKSELSRVHKLQEQIQTDIAELKREITNLDPLSSDDEGNFSSAPPLSPEDGTKSQTHDSPLSVSLRSASGELSFYEKVTSAVTQLGLSVRLPLDRFDPPRPEPTSRAGFLRCACDITLDPHTAHPCLLLCPENRGVSLRKPISSVSEHPHRFNHYRQVLSQQALSGRCYWEVEWSGEGGVRIAVSYEDIQRRGNSDACAFGHNRRSWALDTSDGGFSFWFNKERLRLSKPLCPRVGVYLDHAAGLLSFYSVSQTMSLLHRLQTSFSQPLHVGVWFYWGYSGDTVSFPRLKDNPFMQLLSS